MWTFPLGRSEGRKHAVVIGRSCRSSWRGGRSCLGGVVTVTVAYLLTFLLADSRWQQVQARAVTYGSGVCLKHINTGHKLFSAKIAWGSGSGQQAVTGIGGAEYDDSVMWYVKEAEASRDTFGAGTAVKCGSTIRLEHVDSEKNLHSHPIKSPISGQFEVSAFGTNGIGNDGDNFLVECLDKSDGGIWNMRQKVALRHQAMGGLLKASSSKKFNRENCPRCPIEGHLEVVIGQEAGQRASPDEAWAAVDGIVLSLSEVEEDETHEHDEL